MLKFKGFSVSSAKLTESYPQVLTCFTIECKNMVGVMDNKQIFIAKMGVRHMKTMSYNLIIWVNVDKISSN